MEIQVETVVGDVVVIGIVYYRVILIAVIVVILMVGILIGISLEEMHD